MTRMLHEHLRQTDLWGRACSGAGLLGSNVAQSLANGRKHSVYHLGL
jgi:hypothetical protein